MPTKCVSCACRLLHRNAKKRHVINWICHIWMCHIVRMYRKRLFPRYDIWLYMHICVFLCLSLWYPFLKHNCIALKYASIFDGWQGSFCLTFHVNENESHLNDILMTFKFISLFRSVCSWQRHTETEPKSRSSGWVFLQFQLVPIVIFCCVKPFAWGNISNNAFIVRLP